MRPPRVATVRRFSADADADTRRAFGQRVMAALDEVGVDPGEDFVLGHPQVLDPAAADLGPFARQSDASRDAALENYPKTGSQRERVLRGIAQAGARGVTRDELAQQLDLGDSTVDARVWELKRGGWVADTDRKRETRQGGEAQTLILTDKARLVLAHEVGEEVVALW